MCIPSQHLLKSNVTTVIQNESAEISALRFVNDHVLVAAIDSVLVSYNLDTQDVVITKEEGKLLLEGVGEINSIHLSSEDNSPLLLVGCDEGIMEVEVEAVRTSKPPTATSILLQPHTAFVTSAKYWKRESTLIEAVELSKPSSGISNSLITESWIVSGSFDCKVLVTKSAKSIQASADTIKSVAIVDLNERSSIVNSGNMKQMFNPPYIHMVDISKQGKGDWCVVAAGDGSLEFIHLGQKFKSEPIEAHGSAIIHASFAQLSTSPDLEVVISAGNDSSISLCAFTESSVPNLETDRSKYADVRERQVELLKRLQNAKGKVNKTQLKLLTSLQSQLSSLKPCLPSISPLLKFQHLHKINYIMTTKRTTSLGNLFVADTSNSITSYQLVSSDRYE